MARILSLSDVKAHLPELVAGVDEREEEVIITKNGKPAAVIVNVKELQRLKETLDVLGNPELMRQIRNSEAYFASGKKGVSYEKLFAQSMKPTRKRRA